MALTQISTQGIKDGTITGTDLATNVDLVDDQKLRLGTGNDLQIYHDPSTGSGLNLIKAVSGFMMIQQQGNGSSITLAATNIHLKNHNNNETFLHGVNNGAVSLYYDNVKKFETTSTGATISGNLQFNDNNKAVFGSGTDLLIYHDGSNSVIRSGGTGQLQIESSNNTNIVMGNAALSETIFKGIVNGAVELYYDNSKKFNTNSEGVSIHGNLALNAADNYKIYLGASNDLQIYFNGTNSIISNDTGDLILGAGNGSSVKLQPEGGEDGLTVNQNGAVELYHDNVKSLETTTEGIEIKKTASGQTARLKIEATNGGQAGIELKTSLSGTNRAARIDMYNQNALQWSIFNDYQQNGTNDFSIRHGAEPAIRALTDGAVELFYDNSKKLETTSGGVEVTGNIIPDANNTRNIGDGTTNFNSIWASNRFRGNDNVSLQLGNSIDFKIRHDGTTNLIESPTGADLHIKMMGGTQDVADQVSAKFIEDGAVELYHNNVKKIFTEAEGASVCGDGSDVHLRLRDSSDNVRGIVHATASVDVGFITADATAWLFRVHDDGSYQHYGSEISDRDKKDNITTISSTSLDKVTKLVPKTFTFKQDETGKVPTDKVFTGFIAQEVKEHLPNLVTGTDGQKDMTVDYNGILAHAVKAITELSAEVEILKTKVAALEAA